MFNTELIRKMFAYEHIYREFNMVDFKFLLKLEEKYSNKVHFKEWVDNNNLIEELKDWLQDKKLEKTFSEVYVIGKTDFEKEMDEIFNEENKDIRMKKLNKCIDRIMSRKENILN